jgi:hypothetical protein
MSATFLSMGMTRGPAGDSETIYRSFTKSAHEKTGRDALRFFPTLGRLSWNDELNFSHRFARLTTLPLRRFFIVAVALHVARKPLALAKALETLENLLNRLVRPWFDLNHRNAISCSKPIRFRHLQ